MRGYWNLVAGRYARSFQTFAKILLPELPPNRNGSVVKKVTSEITFKGYKRHASKEEPQYIIKSDKTDHLAMHKGSALKKIKRS